MGMESGTVYLAYPLVGAATEAGLGVALDTAATGVGYVSVIDGLDMCEMGVTLTAPSTAGQLYCTLMQAAAPGGVYGPLFTLRFPSAAARPAGTTLKRYVTMRLTKGTVLRWDITTPAAGAAGIFYVKAYPTSTSNAKDLLSI